MFSTLLSFLTIITVHQRVGIIARLNDSLLNDTLFTLNSERPVFPDNLSFIDIGLWPEASQNDKSSIEVRRATFRRIADVIVSAQNDTVFILDMTFETVADRETALLLTDSICSLRSPPYIAVEENGGELMVPDNLFWKLMIEKKVPYFPVVANLERFGNEPIRRYQRDYRINRSPVPSLGLALLGHLEFYSDLPKPDSGELPRYQHYFELENTQINILPLSEFKEEQEDRGSPVYMIGAYSSYVDHHPVNSESDFSDKGMPGMLIHLNAGLSMALMKYRTVGEIGTHFLLFVAVLLSSFQILAVRHFFGRYTPVKRSGWTYFSGIMLLLMMLVFLLINIVLVLQGNLEIPTASILMALIVGFIGFFLYQFIDTHILLPLASKTMLRGMNQELKNMIIILISEDDAVRKLNSLIDQFAYMTGLLAMESVSEWIDRFHQNGVVTSKDLKIRKSIKSDLIRPTLGKYRSIIRKLSEIGISDPIIEAESEFNTLLEARNRYRHQVSSSMSYSEWQDSLDFLLLPFMNLMVHLEDALNFRLKQDTGVLILERENKSIHVNPFLRFAECDLHEKKELFIYSSGLFDGKNPIRLEGPTPHCRCRISDEEIFQSYKPIYEIMDLK